MAILAVDLCHQVLLLQYLVYLFRQDGTSGFSLATSDLSVKEDTASAVTHSMKWAQACQAHH